MLKRRNPDKTMIIFHQRFHIILEFDEKADTWIVRTLPLAFQLLYERGKLHVKPSPFERRSKHP